MSATESTLPPVGHDRPAGDTGSSWAVWASLSTTGCCGKDHDEFTSRGRGEEPNPRKKTEFEWNSGNSQERGKPRQGQLSSGHSPSVTRFLSCVECWQDGQWADETKDLSQRLTRNLKGHTRAQLRPKPSIHTQRKATAISPSSPESLSGN